MCCRHQISNLTLRGCDFTGHEVKSNLNMAVITWQRRFCCWQIMFGMSCMDVAMQSFEFARPLGEWFPIFEYLDHCTGRLEEIRISKRKPVPSVLLTHTIV